LGWATEVAQANPELVLIAKVAYQRYIKLKPEKTLEYLDFLLKNDLLEDALSLYVKLIS
jgi:hypothetical protein